ncbi:hypothetical protein [Actinomadura rayongensis]|uniref:Uncharacterized protein n=1 Tax=Actinomadura rayongensis TaxID=1429076 RepID=A0A6I4W1J4_9ACTN|nr:hypothetical protein [Actinomadura rayongensis]MXQ62540.1 hypothetical protein [Actinomadura rayongensis]
MSRPRQRQDHDRTDPHDPRPGDQEPKNRWTQPYKTPDGTWICRLRHPLTHTQEKAGLLYMVVAIDEDGLTALMRHEDEKATRLEARGPTQ